MKDFKIKFTAAGDMLIQRKISWQLSNALGRKIKKGYVTENG